MRPIEMLSEQQKKVLDLVLTNHQHMGRGTSFSDIAQHIHTGSTRAQQHIRRLAEHGWISLDMSAHRCRAKLSEEGFAVMAEKLMLREAFPDVVSDTERELEFRTVDVIVQAFKDGDKVRKEGSNLVILRGDHRERYALGPIDPS